jgi:hypothetical protein
MIGSASLFQRLGVTGPLPLAAPAADAGDRRGAGPGRAQHHRGDGHRVVAEVRGQGAGRTLLRHNVPNAIGPVVALLVLDVGNAMITFAGLSFLGLGVVPPTPE